MGSGSRWCLLLCFFFVSLSGVNSSTVLSSRTDRSALLQFKTVISGNPLGILSSWNDSTHFCLWGGVTCSKRHARVTVLDLHSQGLSGSISPHIGNLTFLKELSLFNNTFHSAIPPEIGGLHRLQRLFLYNNSLDGQIPSNISGCSALATFDAANNKLAGELPWQIGFLRRLQFLYLRNNGLTGSIPLSFGNLSSLRIMGMSDNYLSGRVPQELGRLKGSLQILQLQRNNLSGEIPASIFNLSNLKDFRFGYNRLHGSLPGSLALLLPKLENFDVAFNRFTGSIPASLSNATNLIQLQVQLNNFTGSVPSMARSHDLLRLAIHENFLGSENVGNNDDLSFLSSLVSAKRLLVVIIAGNKFGGGLPEKIGNLSSNLKILDVSGNRLSGSIPTEIQNLVNLQRFEAYDNKFSGTIPFHIGNMESLEELDLGSNDISGSIPSSIGNLARLIILVLADNRLDGEIPDAIANCSNLIFLDLSDNNLSGFVPPKIMGLTSLSLVLNLSYNQFTGAIPMEVGNLNNLGYLDFSHNMLSDNIPSSLGKCVRLELVFLQANLLEGTIPLSLDSLRGIQLFDVSSNNLSGQIPKFLEDMSSLQLLNLSYNKFEGEVPKGGIFKNISGISVIGNVKLCGGMPELKLLPCHLRQPKKTLSYKWKIFMSAISSLLFLVFIASCLLVFWMKRKCKQHIALGDGFNERVSYRNLHKVTDGFSTTNLIGAGSFGSVYKGVLNINGIENTIAVKVFNLKRRGASKSFMAECEALKNIRHRNLVRIVTVCSGVDNQGNDFKALIYEFVVNGSLENWLHPMENGDDPPRSLNFHQRLNIAIHVASALDYIHNLCETPIVHCDIKPNNVLLDENMVAHVGDFGLARFLQSSAASLSTAGQISSSIGLKGTVGYAPPEYGMGNEISIEGDIYSYGILLLEMFTGRRPTDEFLKEGSNLQSFVNVALSEQRSTIAKVVDPILVNELLIGRILEESVVSILEIGVACSSNFPQERPCISEVLTRLNKLIA